MSDDHRVQFLSRPHVIRRLWWLFAVVLALTVLAQGVFYVKGYFTVDGWFGFGAVYGFFCCLLMVLLARVLGAVLKRPRDYYRERDNDA
ncbi:MAG: hypothetical protein V2I26_10760 [Halieaceae bacterium]|jgi:uncharacterized membrane protein|nr:hypothetical protein [Halieaceae bacterium]